MRICHIITRLIVGGAQENTLLTCEGLQTRGHQVLLLTGPDAGPEGSLTDDARRGGYEVRLIPSMHRAIRPWRDQLAWLEMKRILMEFKPEVVHTHSSKAGVLGRMAARSAGAPLIVHTVHGMSFNRTQSPFVQAAYRWAEWYVARFTDHFISVADAMTSQMVEAGIAPPDRFTTIHSGMRCEWYDPRQYDQSRVRAGWGFHEQDVVVGTIARLFDNKGYEHLIPAMSQAIRREPRLRFVWVGDGPNRQEYEQELESAGIRAQVHLAGLIPPARVAEAIAGFDLLVHPSQWEGLPRAAVQALLMEKPVISFDIDGAPEVVIPDQTGLLVEMGDVAGLANAVVRLSQNPQERARMGRNGREKCLRQFDHQYMVERIDRLYQRLCNRQSPC